MSCHRNARQQWIIVLMSIASFASCVKVTVATDKYCGIHAVYGAARALGRDGEFAPLLDEQFISNNMGSSVDDLVRAAKFFELEATPLRALSMVSLRRAQTPLILHMASSGQLEAFNHWVLFVGIEHDQCRVVEHDGVTTRISPAKLLSRWDGIAIAIHPPTEPATLGSFELAGLGWWSLAVSSLLVLVDRGLQGMTRTSWFAQKSCKVRGTSDPAAAPRYLGLVVIATSIFLLVSWREFVQTDNLWRNSDAVAYVAAMHLNQTPPKATLDFVLAVSEGRKKGMLIDARYARDFVAGSIPGAVSLPVDATEGTIQRLATKIVEGDPVIVFCQSSGCGFDEIMIKRLRGEGVTEMYTWHDGYLGWENRLRNGSSDDTGTNSGSDDG